MPPHNILEAILFIYVVAQLFNHEQKNSVQAEFKYILYMLN
jgi:hypothetical protein